MITKSWNGALKAALVSTVLWMPSPAAADLETALENMLGANVQVNSGGSLSTAKRGGFFGGSVYIRGKVVNVNVLNFTPPSFSSGCGGVDIFGGSFSMINAEQFVALLRSIAQNAAGYAFHLALKNICEQCSTIMSGLQRAVQEMNQFTGNSCQLAKGIVNSGVAALELQDVKGMQGTTIASGFNDAFEAFWGSLDATISALGAENPGGGSDYEDKYEVNVVWAAMKDSSMSGWFTGGDNSLLEALMSMTGTVVLQGPYDDTDGNPSRRVTPAVAGSNITARDLVFGNDNARFLDCTDTNKCLNMGVSERDLKGLEEILRETYMGSGPGDTGSVLYKIVNGTAGADEATNTLIGQLGHIGSQIIRIAKTSPKGSEAAYRLFEQNKDYIAYELARTFTAVAAASVEQAIMSRKFETSYADDWRRNDFQNALRRIGAELDSIAQTIPDPLESMQLFMSMHQYQVLTESPFN